MSNDTYVKFMLGVIALCLLLICIKYLTTPTSTFAMQAQGADKPPVRVAGFAAGSLTRNLTL